MKQTHHVKPLIYRVKIAKFAKIERLSFSASQRLRSEILQFACIEADKNFAPNSALPLNCLDAKGLSGSRTVAEGILVALRTGKPTSKAVYRRGRKETQRNIPLRVGA